MNDLGDLRDALGFAIWFGIIFLGGWLGYGIGWLIWRRG